MLPKEGLALAGLGDRHQLLGEGLCDPPDLASRLLGAL